MYKIDNSCMQNNKASTRMDKIDSGMQYDYPSNCTYKSDSGGMRPVILLRILGNYLCLYIWTNFTKILGK